MRNVCPNPFANDWGFAFYVKKFPPFCRTTGCVKLNANVCSNQRCLKMKSSTLQTKYRIVASHAVFKNQNIMSTASPPFRHRSGLAALIVALYRARKILSTRLSGRLFSLGRLEKFFGVTYNVHNNQVAPIKNFYLLLRTVKSSNRLANDWRIRALCKKNSRRFAGRRVA